MYPPKENDIRFLEESCYPLKCHKVAFCWRVILKHDGCHAEGVEDRVKNRGHEGQHGGVAPSWCEHHEDPWKYTKVR